MEFDFTWLLIGVPIAFGHWSTLGLRNRPDLLFSDIRMPGASGLAGVMEGQAQDGTTLRVRSSNRRSASSRRCCRTRRRRSASPAAATSRRWRT